MKVLKDYVRERRELLGLTVTALAEAAGLSKSEVSAIEQGRIKLPGAEKRRQLADALGIRHIDLIVAAGELEPYEVPGPSPSVQNLNDPVERLCELMRRVDLDVNQRQEALETTIQMFLAQDRRAGRVVEMVADAQHEAG